jgi:hypothetical protein
MLYREIIAVCFEIRTEHINSVCEQSIGFFKVIPGGKYSDQQAVKG